MRPWCPLSSSPARAWVFSPSVLSSCGRALTPGLIRRRPRSQTDAWPDTERTHSPHTERAAACVHPHSRTRLVPPPAMANVMKVRRGRGTGSRGSGGVCRKRTTRKATERRREKRRLPGEMHPEVGDTPLDDGSLPAEASAAGRVQQQPASQPSIRIPIPAADAGPSGASANPSEQSNRYGGLRSPCVPCVEPLRSTRAIEHGNTGLDRRRERAPATTDVVTRCERDWHLRYESAPRALLCSSHPALFSFRVVRPLSDVRV